MLGPFTYNNYSAIITGPDSFTPKHLSGDTPERTLMVARLQADSFAFADREQCDQVGYLFAASPNLPPPLSIGHDE